ncbi:MAG: HAD hydrolase family protein [Cyanobacteria bacterium SZAS LIN-3]|nr:HAD hydrolase family protein [Cyanobacteria bacterium SZAS LIN-3]MBS2006662.1 HAD hydrolase family protein [Cyanobacteria bacterium SZAS TMP-1]
MESTLTVKDSVMARAAKVKLILMDVDGVLTNGNLYYFPGPDGKPTEFKSFNSQDGAGIHCLNLVGIKTGVISGRDSQAVTERARILKMTYVYQGHLEKEGIYEEILKKENLEDESVAFIGDDFPDYVILKRCGFAVAVGNARPELIERAHYVTKANGGEGAVREVAELVIRARGEWPLVLKKFGFTD